MSVKMTIIYLDRQKYIIIIGLASIISALICGILIGHFGISKPDGENQREVKSMIESVTKKNAASPL